MTDEEKIAEIIRLNDEALDNYFKNSDGHAKSSEGYVTLETHYGTYYDRRDDEEFKPFTRVTVYGYVLGPHRSHDFKSLDEALETVREWHKREMEYDYPEEESGW